MTAEFYEDEKITEEEQQIGSWEAFGKLMPLLKDRVGGLIGCLALLVGGTALSLAWPILLRDALDVDIANGDFNGLLISVLAIAGIQVTTIGVQYVMRIWLETIGQDVMLKLKRRLFHHILSLDISFFDKNPVGRLLSRVESDTEALRLMFTNTVVLVVGDVLLIAGLYGLMFYFEWEMALVLFATVPIISGMVWIFHKKTTPRFLMVRKRVAEVTATLTEFLHGMSIVQIFHRGVYARKRVFDTNLAKFKDDVYVNMGVIMFFNSVFFLEDVKIGLVLILGPILGLSFGTIVMFIMYIWRSFEPIWRTSEQLSNFQKSVAGSKRIFTLLSQETSVPDPVTPVQWSRLKQSIRFENVWFAYEDENWVLRDVSFEIEVGQSLALVGVTGGGKTTVIALLLRMYDPQKGRITVDGIDLRDLSKADLRKRFALVLQDILLFPGSVTDNISLQSDDVSEEMVRVASQTVEAERFIERLPDSYDTEVSEKGANFSRGERQLLSFARALAVDPDVLILDEATSSVDPETERTVQSSLSKLMSGRTSIVIAHRLSTILDVDQILVMRRGEIVERGNHTELLLEDGYYAKLFHLQFKNRNGVVANAK